MGTKELDFAYMQICMAEQALWAVDMLHGVKPTTDSYDYSAFIVGGIEKAFDSKLCTVST